MSSTNALEEQITVLVHELEEIREAKRREEVRWEAECKEVEAVVERAHEAEQHRLQEEAEVRLECKWRNVEERRIEQERQEQEEEEA